MLLWPQISWSTSNAARVTFDAAAENEEGDRSMWGGRPTDSSGSVWSCNYSLTRQVAHDELCNTFWAARDWALPLVWLCSLSSNSATGSYRSERDLQVFKAFKKYHIKNTNIIISPQREGIVQWPPSYWPLFSARLVPSSQISFLVASTSFLPTSFDQVFFWSCSWLGDQEGCWFPPSWSFYTAANSLRDFRSLK